jgi:hypothetical protein
MYRGSRDTRTGLDVTEKRRKNLLRLGIESPSFISQTLTKL